MKFLILAHPFRGGQIERPHASCLSFWQESERPRNGSGHYSKLSENGSSISVGTLGAARSQNWPSILMFSPQLSAWLSPSPLPKRMALLGHGGLHAYPVAWSVCF